MFTLPDMTDGKVRFSNIDNNTQKVHQTPWTNMVKNLLLLFIHTLTQGLIRFHDSVYEYLFCL